MLPTQKRTIYSMAGTIALGLMASTLFAQAPEADPSVSRSRTAYPTGDVNTSILLIERLTPSSVRLGIPLTYEIHLRNLTRSNLDNLQLTEQLPDDFEVRSIEPNPARRDGNEASWNIRSLQPNIPFVVKVTGVPSKLGRINACNTVTFSTTTCQETHIVEPALKLVKTALPEALICDPIPMTFRVSNTGSGPAKDVKIEDELPEGWTAGDDSRKLTFNVGTLAAGESKEFSAQARSSQTGTFTNTARATESGGMSAEASAQTIIRKPQLEVTKTGPEMRYLGRDVTYEITVKNVGDGPANNTVLVDETDADMQFVSASEGGRFADSRVTWQVGNLAPDASKKYTVTMKPMKRKTVRNTATATAYCAEGRASVSTEIRGIPALLLECIDVDDPIEVGANETYIITVTNQGSAEATGIVMACGLPEEQAFVSAEGPTKHEVEGRTITFAALPRLDVGAKAVYKVVAKCREEGDLRFRVKMTGDQLSSPVEETESTHVYR